MLNKAFVKDISVGGMVIYFYKPSNPDDGGIFIAEKIAEPNIISDVYGFDLGLLEDNIPVEDETEIIIVEVLPNELVKKIRKADKKKNYIEMEELLSKAYPEYMV